jgi:hypothetical protein
MKASICFLGLTCSTLFAVPTKDRDHGILFHHPPAVRKACKETSPDATYRILRIVEHQKDKPHTYTVTFFNGGPGAALRKVGDDWMAALSEPALRPQRHLPAIPVDQEPELVGDDRPQSDQR